MAKTLGSGKTITFQKALYDGESSIFKEKRRGDNYQFRMWIKEEKKHYQKRNQELLCVAHNLGACF